jgi:acyl-CoA synthetase (AMP-forming)/AMP-acid ligase II
MALDRSNLIRGPWRSLQPYPHAPAWSYLMRSARRDPQGVAIVEGDGRETSFGELWRYSLGVARYLQRHGNVSAGETVAVGSHGGCDGAAALFGSLLAGARVSPVGVSLKSHDAAHQLQDCGAVFALAPEPLISTIREVVDSGCLRSLRGTFPFPLIRSMAESSPEPPEPATIDSDRDVAMLPYSSGSSGLPKGVMITHRQFIAATRQQLVTSALKRGARVLNLRLSWTRLQLTVAAGVTYIAPPGQGAELIASQIERFRATDLLTKPSTLLSLIEEQQRHPRDFSSLRSIETGAEALLDHIQREAEKIFGCPVFQAYHQTETCGSSNRTPRQAPWPGSVGWPVPDTEERIVDVETGIDVPMGGEGELLIRGPQVCWAT